MAEPDVMWDVRKPGPTHPVNDEPATVINGNGGDGGEHFPDAEGFIHIPLPDGTMEIVFRGPDDQPDEGEGPRDSAFDENLAEHIDQMELTRIAEMLLEGISQDETSREEWLSTREEGIKLLGLQLEKPRSGPGGGTTGTPLQGMATAKDTTLLEAVVRGQANAIGEFLPADGPAKIENVGDGDGDQAAQLLEKNFNYFLTQVATEYYPDTKRMFAWLYFGGSGFKKLYHHPLRRRPVSESVDPQDIVVSNAATDLQNADRVTHITEMRQSDFRRMVMEGVYRDVALIPPSMPDRNRVDTLLEFIEGVRATYHRPEDMPHTLYECYCELDIEDDPRVPSKFKKFSVPLPYRVTIEKDTRTILEVRRDWREEDEECARRKTFVRYSFVDWLGFYGLGLLHLIGNLQLALTAMLRIAIDNGMFANFPGGLMAKKFGAEQTTNNINPGPGQFAMVDLAGLDDINKAVMKLPYSDVTGGLLNLINMVREFAQRVAGTADLPVGEGKADIPVGTILAMIEQSSKVESAVHKGMHTAQAEEFEIMLDLLREDPGALFRHLKKKKKNRFSSSGWNEDAALRALNDYDLIPKSDPNTPSRIHRIMKVVALLNLVQQNPGAFDLNAVMTEAMLTLGYTNPQQFLKDPNLPPPPPSPDEIAAQAKMITAQTGQSKALSDAQLKQGDQQVKAADQKNEQDLADKKLAAELVIHSADREKIAAETAARTADTRLAQRKQVHEENLAQAEHGLNLRSHALDAATAAHEAAVDTHEAGLAQQQLGLDAQEAAKPEKPK
jgi:hypothetical protein